MQRRKGFSLLELIIVIAILGILSTVGLLTIRRDTPQVGEAARILAADLMRARTEAIRLNTTVALKVNAATNSYSMFVDSACDGTSDDGTTIMQRDLSGDFPLADLITAETDTTKQHICFDVRGLPRSGSVLFLTNAVSVKSSKDANYKLAINVSSQGQIKVVKL